MLIAGVDEVGRGPLAGPVTAAAVILTDPIPGLRDSKKMSSKQRERMVQYIQAQAICYAYGRSEVDEIEQLNIHHATLLAMKRAIEGLKIKPDLVMIDGLYIPDTALPCEAIVKGDDSVHQISAASVLAKVARDAEMTDMDKLYPGYYFARHKGYPTQLHRVMLKQLGPSPIHRKNYSPVAESIR